MIHLIGEGLKLAPHLVDLAKQVSIGRLGWLVGEDQVIAFRVVVERSGHRLGRLGDDAPRSSDDEVGRVPHRDDHPSSTTIALISDPSLGSGSDT